MVKSFFAGIIAFCLAFGAHAAVPHLPPQSWKTLTPEQQQILHPLADEWDKMESFRRKKWLGVADRYPNLSPEEQARVQRRMKTWAALTPEERRIAREQYKNLKKAPPEKRETVKQKWEAYKELSDAEKLRLKQHIWRRPLSKENLGQPFVASMLKPAIPKPAIPPTPSTPAVLPPLKPIVPKRPSVSPLNTAR